MEAATKANFFDIGRVASQLPPINQHILYGIAVGMKADAELVQKRKSEAKPDKDAS